MPVLKDKSETIGAIVRAAERPCPEIVEVFRLLDPETGKKYSPFGIPFGIDHSKLERVSVGFAYRDKSTSTTYGNIYQTRHDAAAIHDERAAKNSADFRMRLEAMTESELIEQSAYWLKDRT